MLKKRFSPSCPSHGSEDQNPSSYKGITSCHSCGAFNRNRNSISGQMALCTLDKCKQHLNDPFRNNVLEDVEPELELTPRSFLPPTPSETPTESERDLDSSIGPCRQDFDSLSQDLDSCSTLTGFYFGNSPSKVTGCSKVLLDKDNHFKGLYFYAFFLASFLVSVILTPFSALLLYWSCQHFFEELEEEFPVPPPAWPPISIHGPHKQGPRDKFAPLKVYGKAAVSGLQGGMGVAFLCGTVILRWFAPNTVMWYLASLISLTLGFICLTLSIWYFGVLSTLFSVSTVKEKQEYDYPSFQPKVSMERFYLTLHYLIPFSAGIVSSLALTPILSSLLLLFSTHPSQTLGFVGGISSVCSGIGILIIFIGNSIAVSIMIKLGYVISVLGALVMVYTLLRLRSVCMTHSFS